MNEFIGRQVELSRLESLYASPNGIDRTCAIYGRRRIGKSALIEKFCEGKRAVYVPCVYDSDIRNAALLCGAMRPYREGLPDSARFSDALDALWDVCREAKTVVVFDEYPYLAQSMRGASSEMQRFIDQCIFKTDSFLILCGSSIKIMRSELEDYSRPLYGRVMNRIEVGPISLKESKLYHPGMSDIDVMKTYLTVGGIPLYHRLMNGKSYRDSMMRCFLGRDGVLAEEAPAIISRELSPASTHMDILSVMAGGATSVKEIAEKAGITQSLCSKYIKNLCFIGIAERVNPMANSPAAPVYKIRDSLTRFYFELIDCRKGMFATESKSIAFNRLAHDLDSFFGIEFEKTCVEYVKRNYACMNVGSWWGWDGKEVSEIDLVAKITDGRTESMLVGECKFWQKKVVGEGVFRTLKRRAELVKGLFNVRYVLFSASEFDEGLEYLEQNGDVTLVGLEDLLGDSTAKNPHR
ncbi:MAG: ATP-binding protein [Candidatus Methanoplasma sp.]|jgi:AAA+ ATPase superfamily predicted ATPase|nr:ATP-binding protein [Candidatus Methanoplasma sp.]